MQMKVMARQLVSNEQGGSLKALQVSANQPMFQQTLGALVVHAVAVLISRSNLNILHPILLLLNDPGTMAVSYSRRKQPFLELVLYVFQQCLLPTMAEDMMTEAKRGLKENGHFYGLYTHFIQLLF